MIQEEYSYDDITAEDSQDLQNDDFRRLAKNTLELSLCSG